MRALTLALDRRRLLGVGLLAAWVLPLVLTAAHQLTAAHRYCPEHGVFEEVSAAPRPLTPVGPVDQAVPGVERIAHERCAFAAVTAQGPTATIQPVAALLPDGPALVGLPEPPPTALALLHVAPKTSPPSP